jgi:hypothetical protein
MSKSRLVLAAIAIFAASVLLGGVAVAVGTTDKVAACTSHKHVRVLGHKVKCHKGEKRIAWHVQGKTGPTGARGPTGPRGATGGIGNVRTDFATGPIPMSNPSLGAAMTAEAYCRPDEQAIAGGYALLYETQLDVVQESRPVLGPTGLQGWHVKIVAAPPLPGNHNVKAYVVCGKT